MENNGSSLLYVNLCPSPWEEHRYTQEIDQSYLGPLIKSLSLILKKYPLIYCEPNQNSSSNYEQILNNLTVDEELLIAQCLQACINDFFGDEEFETLFGLSRTKMMEIAQHWPSNKFHQDTHLAIHNALGNLLGYPLGNISDFDICNPERWKGLNRLGFILMKIREKLR